MHFYRALTLDFIDCLSRVFVHFKHLVVLGILQAGIDVLAINHLLAQVLNAIQQGADFDLLRLDLQLQVLVATLLFSHLRLHHGKVLILERDGLGEVLFVLHVARDVLVKRLLHAAHKVVNFLLQVAILLPDDVRI